ncbi:MAG TPA: hypothetical protein P5230_02645 [Candidatus Magasanikbacteria bacterium]|nr:hypothetical protein [Candidatus Magasanikbacteria bacterium]
MAEAIMKVLIVVLVVLVVIFLATAVFLASELVKKFSFMRSFIISSRCLIEYYWPGAELAGVKRGMRNIVLVWDQPFNVLIGFELTLPGLKPGFDYYGHATAECIGDKYAVVVNTYCGGGDARFQFFVNHEVDEKFAVSSTEEDQQKKPHATYPPHWWQTIGFYG